MLLSIPDRSGARRYCPAAGPARPAPGAGGAGPPSTRRETARAGGRTPLALAERNTPRRRRRPPSLPGRASGRTPARARVLARTARRRTGEETARLLLLEG